MIRGRGGRLRGRSSRSENESGRGSTHFNNTANTVAQVDAPMPEVEPNVGSSGTHDRGPNRGTDVPITLDRKTYIEPANHTKLSRGERESAAIYNAWKASCSRRYVDMLSSARKQAMQALGTTNLFETKGHPPTFMTATVWNELIENHWNTPKWQQKLNAVKQNRFIEKEGEITKHTFGSIPFATHKRMMEQENTEPISYLELFNRMHRRDKGNGVFVDKKSETGKYK